jgi:hypothetical protein
MGDKKNKRGSRVGKRRRRKSYYNNLKKSRQAIRAQKKDTNFELVAPENGGFDVNCSGAEAPEAEALEAGEETEESEGSDGEEEDLLDDIFNGDDEQEDRDFSNFVQATLKTRKLKLTKPPILPKKERSTGKVRKFRKRKRDQELAKSASSCDKKVFASFFTAGPKKKKKKLSLEANAVAAPNAANGNNRDNEPLKKRRNPMQILLEESGSSTLDVESRRVHEDSGSAMEEDDSDGKEARKLGRRVMEIEDLRKAYDELGTFVQEGGVIDKRNFQEMTKWEKGYVLDTLVVLKKLSMNYDGSNFMAIVENCLGSKPKSHRGATLRRAVRVFVDKRKLPLSLKSLKNSMRSDIMDSDFATAVLLRFRDH